jgi:hypothetical protein
METTPKYSIDDIFQHNEYQNEKRKILHIYYDYYENNNKNNNKNKKMFYLIHDLQNRYPPSHMEESVIDKYYTKIEIKN